MDRVQKWSRSLQLFSQHCSRVDLWHCGGRLFQSPTLSNHQNESKRIYHPTLSSHSGSYPPRQFYPATYRFPKNLETSSGLLSSSGITSNGSSNTENNFNINDLIDSYPGIQNTNQSSNNFGIDYSTNSIITPQIISNSQANYDPERDGNQITE